MTTTIIETVSVASWSFSFTEVQQNDVAFASVFALGDGLGISSISMAPWTQFGSSVPNAFGWRQLAAGATNHTFSGTHTIDPPQIIAVLLRSDIVGGQVARIDFLSASEQTQFENDEAGIYNGAAYTHPGAPLTGPWVAMVTSANQGIWRYDPFQVPRYTTLVHSADLETVVAASALALRPWGRGTAPPAQVGWTTWIID